MRTEKDYLVLNIINALPPVVDLHSCAVGALKEEWGEMIFAGGNGGLFWFRKETGKRGMIAKGFFHVGLAIEDIDGDGIKEIVAARQDTEADNRFLIECYKPGKNPEEPWKSYVIDPECAGNPHDILFTDIDGDGAREMLSVAAYSKTPGVFLYKCRGSWMEPWDKHMITEGHLTEGLAVADLNGDGRLEVVSGPDWFTMPKDGPYSGKWERRVYAPNFRDMCRMAIIDITGRGRGDIVAVESEYREGLFSWFENRIKEDPENPWVEHRIADGLVFAHSLQVRKDPSTGESSIFLAEMAKGGWGQPYNWDARLMKYSTVDNGKSWTETILYKGAGTHQAILYDIDGDGEEEVVGKTWKLPVVHIYKKSDSKSRAPMFRHRFIDRDKPYAGTDITTADISGCGLMDVACGAWWYRNPDWERFQIPGISQVLCAYDVDGDGRDELICTKGNDSGNPRTPPLSNNFYWLKPVDTVKGIWEEYFIGTGIGSWPHGSTAGKLLPGGKPAFLAAYHSSKTNSEHCPEVFEIPPDPKSSPWPKRKLAEIQYGEQLKIFDINCDGIVDVVTAKGLLINDGGGNFEFEKFADDFEGARFDIADIDGDGLPDVVAGEEVFKNEDGVMAFSKLVWFKNPGVKKGKWEMRVIDTIRCPHSVSLYDIDGCGQPEIICGEHDPFKPYRSRSRLLVYKKADANGFSWYRYLADDRFEHHNGAKIINLPDGRYGIVSHGWADKQFVHLWTPED